MDEGYYIGGALQLLKGDLFLTTYKSDKPFMINWSLLPGILVFGKNVVGYRFSSFIAGLVSFFFIIKTFQLALFQKSKLLHIFSYCLVLSFFIRDETLRYLASAFTDGFLLMFLSIYFFYTVKYVESGNSKDLDFSYIFWSLAFFTKFSAIMWAPISLGALFFRKGKNINIFREILYVFKSSRWVWAIGVLYFATNRSKFSPVLWLFKNLSYSHADQGRAGLIARVIQWADYPFMEYGVLGGTFIYTLFILSTGLAIYKYRKRELRQNDIIFILCFLCPIILHLIGLPLSGAKFYKRYFFILTANVLVFILGAVYLINVTNKRIEIGIKLLVLSVSIYSFLAIPGPDKKGTFNAIGRIGYLLRDEVSHDSLYLSNEGNSWEIRPYLGDKEIYQNYNASPSNTLKVQVGQSLFYQQFILKRKNDFENIFQEVLPKLPIRYEKTLKVEKIKEKVIEALLNELKLHKIEVVNFQTNESYFDQKGISANTMAVKGSPFTLNLRRKKKNKYMVSKILGDYLNINIKGVFSINKGNISKSKFGNRYSLGARISNVTVDGIDHDLTGLVTVLHQSLFFPLIPVDIKNSEHVRFKNLILKDSLKCDYIVYEN